MSDFLHACCPHCRNELCSCTGALHDPKEIHQIGDFRYCVLNVFAVVGFPVFCILFFDFSREARRKFFNFRAQREEKFLIFGPHLSTFPKNTQIKKRP